MSTNFTLSPKGGEGRVRGRAARELSNYRNDADAILLNHRALRHPLTPTLSPGEGEGGL
jgi:hypothetical protein